MTWSYGPAGDPPIAALTDLDQVRLLIGDTDPTAPLLQDEEIGLYLTGGLQAQSSLLLAGAMCAVVLASRYRRLVDIREGAAAASLSQLANQYTTLAADLRAQAGFSGIAPAAGMTAMATCSSRGPAFTRTIGDDSGAGDWPR